MTTLQSKPTVIEPSEGWLPLELGEIWRYRELLLFLTWRDIKVRYKQTLLGASWTLIQPILSVITLSIIFGVLARLPSNGVPYPIFTFAGLVPWLYFSSTLTRGSSSLVANAQMVGRVYFPRLLLPLASMAANLVDFAVALTALLIMLPVYGVHPGIGVITLPLFLLLLIATALGFSVWPAALNVRYRDIGNVVPFLTQLWLFASPVAYSASLVHGKLAFLYWLNPMASVIGGFRWALFGVQAPTGTHLALSTAIALAVLLSGLYYFRRAEQNFADIV